MANIQISELTSDSMVELNSLETIELMGGRNRGRGRGIGRNLNFYNILNNQQATNIAFVINYGDNSNIYISQIASNISVINVN